MRFKPADAADRAHRQSDVNIGAKRLGELVGNDSDRTRIVPQLPRSVIRTKGFSVTHHGIADDRYLGKMLEPKSAFECILARIHRSNQNDGPRKPDGLEELSRDQQQTYVDV